MNIGFLNRKFERIGARLQVVQLRPGWNVRQSLSLDIGTDKRGEFYSLAVAADNSPQVEVIDVRPAMRHLLLLSRDDDGKSKYLCGHDERHWFVAGIPEQAPVGNVVQAMKALQPKEVRNAVSRKRLSGKARNRRKNAAFIRQGEWFFLPVNNLAVDKALVLKNEPIRRGGGKPHMVEFCFRSGGETVHVCSRHPNGVTAGKYREILFKNRSAKKWNWTVMQRNPGVYVRGRVRHPDHATITLHGWHQVVMNTESESRAMRNVAFLD